MFTRIHELNHDAWKKYFLHWYEKKVQKQEPVSGLHVLKKEKKRKKEEDLYQVNTTQEERKISIWWLSMH